MGRLDTVLGKDELALQGFDGTDALNTLYSYSVTCLGGNADVKFDDLIGTHATVTLICRSGEERYYDGIVTEAGWRGAGDNGHRYQLVLRPWLYLATMRRNQRIFHEQTPVQIIEQVLSDYAAAGSFKVEVTGEMPILEYTVQYRESDFAFVSRIMERFGITYHFTHAQAEHLMVLTDAIEQHDTIGERPFKPYDGHHQEDIDHFWDWTPARRMTTGMIRLMDYNFKTPLAAMETEFQSDAGYEHGHIESYDYPGDYLEQSKGERVAQLRTEQERVADRHYVASGDIPTLGSGMRVALGGDEVPGRGDEYLCVSASHSYTSDNYGTGGSSGDGYAYSGQYLLIPVAVPLRPERKTPLALVQGPQTAVVVGEGEIDCDEYGRILVQFHWDLDAAYSMRCRVSQNWAGNGWGGMVIPRIGMEVVVEFLEGDPDKPLVTGCVYNGKNDVPYPLPADKTRSTFKTDTHRGTGYNELRFEDKRDEEEVYIHAQRDMNEKVERNHSHRTNRNLVESVGHDKASEISNSFKQMVGGDMNLGVGPGKLGSITPAGARANTQGIGAVSEGMGDVGTNPGKGNLTIAVEATKTQTIEESHFETVREDKDTKVKQHYRLDVGKTIEITAGDSIKIQVGRSILTMDDRGNIELNGGQTNITMSDLFKVLASTIKLN
ncbi:MAG: type VI secretion system tip protein TssI/VgrG [Pseudomonadota bacterium]|nr:type VI secretion system tip protein TssI/VgrG [Pseudomonadota bacterium]